jgi:hypothetical protein
VVRTELPRSGRTRTPGAPVGVLDGVKNKVVAGADPAVLGSGRGDDGNGVGADLLHQQAQACSKLGTMGNEYDAHGCVHEQPH